MVSPLNKGSRILAVDVHKVLGLHDEPDPLYGVEVGRIWRKVQRLKEVPIEALAFVPGGIVEDKDIPFSGGDDGLYRFIEECLKDIGITMACLYGEELTCAGTYAPQDV